MSTRELSQAAKDREALRRQIDEYVETQTWAHHVADLASGKVVTTSLRRPVAPLSRARRLQRFAPHIDTSIFGGPTYRLTARQPYQAQPEAWMIASVVGDYSTLSDFILWQLPREQTGALFQQLQC